MGPTEARRTGEELAVELMRHPGRITEELVTMRVVQTLSIVDLLNYRNHVWRLGEYGEARIVKHIDSIRETVLESFCHLGKQLRTKLDPDAEGDTRVLK